MQLSIRYRNEGGGSGDRGGDATGGWGPVVLRESPGRALEGICKPRCLSQEKNMVNAWLIFIKTTCLRQKMKDAFKITRCPSILSSGLPGATSCWIVSEGLPRLFNVLKSLWVSFGSVSTTAGKSGPTAEFSSPFSGQTTVFLPYVQHRVRLDTRAPRLEHVSAAD